MQYLIYAAVAVIAIVAILLLTTKTDTSAFCSGMTGCTAGDCFNCQTGADEGVEQTGAEDDYYAQ